MIYDGLMAGWSRGFTLLTRPTVESERELAPAERAAEWDAAAKRDLVAALRFPLAPSWILETPRRPLPSVLPEAAPPQPRGCG